MRSNVGAGGHHEHFGRDRFQAHLLGTGAEFGLVDFVGRFAPDFAKHGVEGSPQRLGGLFGSEEFRRELAPGRMRKRNDKSGQAETGVALHVSCH